MLRLTCIFSIIFIYVVFNFYVSDTVVIPHAPFPVRRNFYRMNNFCYEQNTYLERKYPSFEPFGIFKLLVIGFTIVFFLIVLLLHLCNSVRYVTFTTNLTLSRKKKEISMSPRSVLEFLSLLLVWLFSAESPENYFSLLIILPDLGCGNIFKLTVKLRKALFQILFLILSIYIFYLATTPSACILCLLLFQTLCYSMNQNNPKWLQILLIALSNDVHQNPGPAFHNCFFTFMTWNVNSLSKDNFKRVDLIEADNSNFNYDLIAICETSLNDSIKLPDKLLNDYTFVPSENPTNTRHGGVGLFYKNSLPIKIRNDLSFEDSIVAELNFGQKKYFLQ